MKTKQIVSGFRMGDRVRLADNHDAQGTVLFYSHAALQATVQMDCGLTLIWESSSLLLLDRPQSVNELIEESMRVAKTMDRPWWKRMLRIS